MAIPLLMAMPLVSFETRKKKKNADTKGYP